MPNSTITAAAKTNGKAARRLPKGVPVAELIGDEQLDAYGYLLLPSGVMQTAGSATQTIAAIRSHWGRATFADERTIAIAACLDESTVRRRHLPKLCRMEYLKQSMVKSKRGERREWRFATPMSRPYFDHQHVTLPRWAALSLPEWSYRAIYAVVLQRSLATARGSRKGPVELENDDVLWGGYGRHNFSLSHLSEQTGLSRETAHDAKTWLLQNEWLTWQEGDGRGDNLYINGEKLIPADVLQKAHQTTRRMMFQKAKGGTNGKP